jgi:hypothetical protein
MLAADCADCHPAIAASYAKTGMGRSFTSADKARPYVGRPQDRKVQADYAFGSGDHAISYLHRTKDNKLIEMPSSWYSEKGGHWAPSPGYDRPNYPGFTRTIAYRCLFCHDAYPTLDPGHGDTEGEAVFPAKLPEGIECARCHGPGAAHMQAARGGRPAAEIRAAIVNPARLTPDRQLDVCMQCHLETTSLAPFAVTRFDRRVFSYMPGEPLGDFIRYLDHAPGTGHDDKLELVSEAYRLRQSPCFLKSNGRMTCTTCHNPHEEASGNTDRVCASCHEPHTQTGSCVACHMPKRQASDAIHIAITDHRIARRPAPQLPLIEQHDGNTPPYTGEVVAYYPNPSAKMRAAEMPEFYFRAGRFDDALKLAPDNWRYLYGAGRAKQDVTLLERAWALAPWETNILHALGAAYFNANRLNDAIRAFRMAAERDPEDAAAFSNLGNMLQRAGDSAGAEKAFKEARRLLPEMTIHQGNR